MTSIKEISDMVYDGERALYESEGITLHRCRFEGAADGESALKESERVVAYNCFFDLRYPLWHCHGVSLEGCEMTERCRAPLWYTAHANIVSCRVNGTKAIRE